MSRQILSPLLSAIRLAVFLASISLLLVPQAQVAPYAYIPLDGDQLAIIDVATHSLLTTIPNISARGVAIDQDGTHVYLAGGKLIVLDAQTFEVLDRIEGAGDQGVAVHPDGRFAHVAVSGAFELAIVDLLLGETVNRIPVGQDPWGVAVHPDGSVV